MSVATLPARLTGRGVLVLVAAASLALAGCSGGGSAPEPSVSPSVSPSAADDEDLDEDLDEDFDGDEFTEADIVDLQPGDCILWSAGPGDDLDIPTVPCTDEHDTVILSVVELPEGEFPEDGTDAFETLDTGTVAPACASAFEAWDAAPRTRDDWDFDALWPMQEEWDLGYRKVQCYAYDTTTVDEDDEIDLGDGTEYDESELEEMEDLELELDENGELVIE